MIEIIVVILVLGIAAVGVDAIQQNIFGGHASLKDMQARTRIVEECAEQTLAVRMHNVYGYEEVGSARFGAAHCDALTAQGSFAIPGVSIDTTTPVAWCPTAAFCKTVTITQTQSGTSITPIVLVLVDY